MYDDVTVPDMHLAVALSGNLQPLLLARFALMKSASSPSPGSGPFAGFGLGSKTRAAKLTRLSFVAYLVVMHVFLFRAAIYGESPNGGI